MKVAHGQLLLAAAVVAGWCLADGRLAAEARGVLVGYDYTRGESVEIPAQWREWLEPSEVAI